MKEITNIGTLYLPQAALVFYQCEDDNALYTEYFDIDEEGQPINIRPLSNREVRYLVQHLISPKEAQKPYLQSKGILPKNVLHIDYTADRVLWYTPPQRRKLYFKSDLGIPTGKAAIPALLWVANLQELKVFALDLQEDEVPNENTPLYNAPFFNVYPTGSVCMGNIAVEVRHCTHLEAFISTWEGYFFNSYFSHLIGQNPINGNCVSLWQSLINTDNPFPIEVLLSNEQILSDFLNTEKR